MGKTRGGINHDSNKFAVVVLSPDYVVPNELFKELKLSYQPEPQVGMIDGLSLTISNGTETKTYTQDSGPFEAIAYNWTTGQSLNIDGSIYDDVGTPIVVPTLSGTNTLQSSVGATKVTYKAYPGAVIEKLQNEIDALKAGSD